MLAVRQGGETTGQIAVGSRPRPEPGPDEVLVGVEASAINPFALGVVIGHQSRTALERVPGRDLAGVVEQAPPGLVGQRQHGDTEPR
jgi:NADPH:quinone reductase